MLKDYLRIYVYLVKSIYTCNWQGNIAIKYKLKKCKFRNKEHVFINLNIGVVFKGNIIVKLHTLIFKT